MPLISEAQHPSIRAALDLTLGAKALPSEKIELPIFQGAAETAVLARYPTAQAMVDASTAPGTDGAHVQAAVILLTAAYIAPALPSLISEEFAEYRYQRQKYDPESLAASLLARAEAELDAISISTQEPSDDYPVFFTTAPGARGQLSSGLIV